MTRTHVEAEITSQPSTWREAAALLPSVAGLLPRRGERVAVVGCGTSWFMAMAYAGLREAAGQGETDAFTASEFPTARAYDRVVAITRSGTTTEVLRLLAAVDAPTVAITGVPQEQVKDVADEIIGLPFADEESVVQTRFATTTLALLRAHLGDDVEGFAGDAERALAADITPHLSAGQISFVGQGWTIGLAHEAALKTREAAQFWAEAYPAMDYRHGPVAIAEPGREVWSFGAAPDGLAEQVAATGAGFVSNDLDPLAQLVLAQRVAVGLALARDLDPDRPRHLTRAVELPD
ncbi:fructoselysine-6-P-deglycase FrlB-like protein [Nocardioides albertanoniae]|uniref:Fructoselysine-6-P-deglycase FrlB-like protein n=1 Tax=Nocardioides albertanoniae TaxID=1175486 RepID=A0A543A339_9ACTN|nr:sugar isomerase [Nocardioides albertanoniae]TQL67003.1 fructoselysine-6-P-deglycase FrlB-like protein [Nocardioides albertanoniae]